MAALLERPGEIATVVRYDERGYGLSDWDVDNFRLEARVADLEAVVDHAGLGRFALMAMAQGGPPSIVYAVRHSERVSRLMFYGSYAAAFRDPTSEDLERHCCVKPSHAHDTANLPTGR